MHACALTDTGRKRPINQDYLFCSEDPVGNLPNLFVVADGMGGHQAGEYASREAVNMLLRLVEANAGHDPSVLLKSCVERMNRSLFRRSQEDQALAGMGTTLVAATIADNLMPVVNIGDSRLYVIGREIHQVTKDHSLVEEMVSQGRLVRGSAEYVAKKNVITRAVGVDEQVTPDFYEVKLVEEELVLLCSDGLTNMVTDGEIYAIVRRGLPLEERAAALIEAANLSGGRDNITVILIEK